MIKLELIPFNKKEEIINDGNNYIESLPAEIIVHILSFLKVDDIKSCSLVNKLFNDLTKESSLSKFTGIYFYPLNQIDVIKKNLLSSDFFCHEPSKSIATFSFHAKELMLARGGNVKSLETLELPTHILLSSSGDTFVNFNNKGTGYPYLQILDHSTLLAGSYEEKVEVLQLPTLKRLHTFTHHSNHSRFGKPFCFQLVNDNLFTGSIPSSIIKMWNFKTQTVEKSFPLSSLNGQCNFCLTANPTHLFAIYDNKGLIGQWEIASTNLIRTFNHASPVSCLQLTEKYLISGGFSDNDNIKIWDYRTGECVKTFSHGYHINSLYAFHDLLFTGGLNGRIVMWDIESGKSTLLATNLGQIQQLQFYRGNLIVNGCHFLDFNLLEKELKVLNIERMKVIASEFGKPKAIPISSLARSNFYLLPPRHKHPIYGELYTIKTPAYFDSRNKNHPSCGEEAFYNQYEPSILDTERQAAINNHLSNLNKN